MKCDPSYRYEVALAAILSENGYESLEQIDTKREEFLVKIRDLQSRKNKILFSDAQVTLNFLNMVNDKYMGICSSFDGIANNETLLYRYIDKYGIENYSWSLNSVPSDYKNSVESLSYTDMCENSVLYNDVKNRFESNWFFTSPLNKEYWELTEEIQQQINVEKIELEEINNSLDTNREELAKLDATRQSIIESATYISEDVWKYTSQDDFEDNKYDVKSGEISSILTNLKNTGVPVSFKSDSTSNISFEYNYLYLNNVEEEMQVIYSLISGTGEFNSSNGEVSYVDNNGKYVYLKTNDDMLSNMSLWASEMDDQQKEIFYYNWNTGGYEAAYDYLENISDELNSTYVYNRTVEDQTYANENSGLASAASVLIGPFEGLKSFEYSVKQLINGDKMYSSQLYSHGDTMRAQVSTNIASNPDDKYAGAKSFMYNVGMSIADNMYSIALTGGNSVASGMILGVGGFDNNMNDALSRGLSDEKAFMYSGSMALVEAATEAVSIDSLLKLKPLSNSAIKRVGDFIGASDDAITAALKTTDDVFDKLKFDELKNICDWEKNTFSRLALNLDDITNPKYRKIVNDGVNWLIGTVSQGTGEGTEELASSIMGEWVDKIFAGDNSSFNLSVESYLNYGYTEAEAIALTQQQQIQEFAMSYLSGLTSGSISGGSKLAGSMAFSDVSSYVSNMISKHNNSNYDVVNATIAENIRTRNFEGAIETIMSQEGKSNTEKAVYASSLINVLSNEDNRMISENMQQKLTDMVQEYVESHSDVKNDKIEDVKDSSIVEMRLFDKDGEIDSSLSEIILDDSFSSELLEDNSENSDDYWFSEENIWDNLADEISEIEKWDLNTFLKDNNIDLDTVEPSKLLFDIKYLTTEQKEIVLSDSKIKECIKEYILEGEKSYSFYDDVFKKVSFVELSDCLDADFLGNLFTNDPKDYIFFASAFNNANDRNQVMDIILENSALFDAFKTKYNDLYTAVVLDIEHYKKLINKIESTNSFSNFGTLSIDDSVFSTLINEEYSINTLSWLINAVNKNEAHIDIISDFYTNDSRAKLTLPYIKNNIDVFLRIGVKFGNDVIYSSEFFEILKTDNMLDFRERINLVEENCDDPDYIELKRKQYYDELIGENLSEKQLYGLYDEILETSQSDEVIDQRLKENKLDEDELYRYKWQKTRLLDENNRKLSEIIVDGLFQDNIYNVWININELLKYDSYLSDGEKILTKEKRDFYTSILNIDSYSTESRIDLYNILKDKDINLMFYEDMRATKDVAYKKINDKMIVPTQHSEYINETETKKNGVTTYDLRNVEHYMLIRKLNGLYGEYSARSGGSSYSLISSNNTSVFHDDRGIIYGYNSFDIDKVEHMFEFDSFSSSSVSIQNKSSNSTNRPNRISSAQEIADSAGYSEIILKNQVLDGKGIHEMKPDFVVVINDVNEKSVAASKALGIPLVIISEGNASTGNVNFLIDSTEGYTFSKCEEDKRIERRNQSKQNGVDFVDMPLPFVDGSISFSQTQKVEDGESLRDRIGLQYFGDKSTNVGVQDNNSVVDLNKSKVMLLNGIRAMDYKYLRKVGLESLGEYIRTGNSMLLSSAGNFRNIVTSMDHDTLIKCYDLIVNEQNVSNVVTETDDSSWVEAEDLGIDDEVDELVDVEFLKDKISDKLSYVINNNSYSKLTELLSFEERIKLISDYLDYVPDITLDSPILSNAIYYNNEFQNNLFTVEEIKKIFLNNGEYKNIIESMQNIFIEKINTSSLEDKQLLFDILMSMDENALGYFSKVNFLLGLNYEQWVILSEKIKNIDINILEEVLYRADDNFVLSYLNNVDLLSIDFQHLNIIVNDFLTIDGRSVFYQIYEKKIMDSLMFNEKITIDERILKKYISKFSEDNKIILLNYISDEYSKVIIFDSLSNENKFKLYFESDFSLDDNEYLSKVDKSFLEEFLLKNSENNRIDIKKDIVKLVSQLKERGITGDLEIARAVYLHLGKLVSYTSEYTDVTNPKFADKINREYLNNIYRNVICYTWSSLYKESLITAGINPEYIKIIHHGNGAHDYVCLNIDGGYYIADATYSYIYDWGNDLINIKIGKPTYGFFRSNYGETIFKGLDTSYKQAFYTSDGTKSIELIDEKIGFFRDYRYEEKVDELHSLLKCDEDFLSNDELADMLIRVLNVPSMNANDTYVFFSNLCGKQIDTCKFKFETYGTMFNSFNCNYVLLSYVSEEGKVKYFVKEDFGKFKEIQDVDGYIKKMNLYLKHSSGEW